jgi:hypothetical protein
VVIGLLLVVVMVAAGLGGVWVWKSQQPATHRAAPVAGSEQAEQTGSKTGAVVKGQIGPAGPTADWVKAENAKPGTGDWHLAKDATNNQIEGFADRVSVTAGESANLFVSTTAPTFHVEAYRMGFYQGLGARLVWKSDEVTGLKQAKATFTPGVNMIEAPWSPSLSVRTDPSWPEGDYLFKLVASTGYDRYVPLTIRNDQNKAAYLVINAVTTWQAYNLWGDYSLYQGAVGRGADAYHRSREVSFDRPYLIGSGAGDFLGNELPFVSMAESLGLDVTYTTSVDVHQNPTTLERHKAALSMGHDEYYSINMRQAMQDARDKGVNLVFFGANAIYRHIRFEASPNGADRRVICYKSTSDPLMGINNADVTVDWRDPPNLQPESVIVGNYYQCNPVKADMVVAAPDHWLLAGTGLADGQHLPKLVGDEYDRYSPASGSPRNMEVIMHSPVVCHGLHDYSDLTYYTAASGAGVFASGTSSWVPAMSCGAADCTGPTLVKITQNLLGAFGLGPAGQKHPSTANAVAISEGANTAPSTSTSTGAPQPVVTSPPTTRAYYAPTTVRHFPATTVGFPPATRR